MKKIINSHQKSTIKKVMNSEDTGGILECPLSLRQ